MTPEEILHHLPYNQPFLFVDEIVSINSESVHGKYWFNPEHSFYQGHFKNKPVTPGVILTECCAQIGLVCLGIYLLGAEGQDEGFNAIQIGLSSSDMEFLLPVPPGETVKVVSEKEYFRFNKLKCQVKMFNAQEELVCKGVLAGMFKTLSHGG
ncbi:3-hydroxyacyl-ACP dehydratase FabZ family protein [Flagellimonas myxillae]|uniref:3-hydroxyacyl-ACP dehydratase FabZ family protein n=1 Tax=Flagellimonas myxillae TaxID=2942214 RepID=UPI00201E7B92|nr:hydroxymyristoyl-ACP dehydratase [Muricauda myxillae]MCL6265884.1 hydroxymyristoyl-ACP dehydratase [Muricauda myxillae]